MGSIGNVTATFYRSNQSVYLEGVGVDVGNSPFKIKPEGPSGLCLRGNVPGFPNGFYVFDLSNYVIHDEYNPSLGVTTFKITIIVLIPSGPTPVCPEQPVFGDASLTVTITNDPPIPTVEFPLENIPVSVV